MAHKLTIGRLAQLTPMFFKNTKLIVAQSPNGNLPPLSKIIFTKFDLFC